MFILTEKKSVAEDIANALGGFSEKNGFFQRNNDCIAYAKGHLLELLEPDDYDEKYHKWNIADLPIIPPKMEYKPNKNKHLLFTIKECFNRFGQSDFFLATDPEREGELIGYEILQFCGFKNYQDAKRFWVAEALTPEVVKKGLLNAKPLLEYSSYKDAGLARSHADWFIGMNLTRLFTKTSGDVLFNFGRVQTALLNAIYTRDNSIQNFVPAPYNQVKAQLQNFSLYLSNNGDTKIPPNGGFIEKAKLLSSNDFITIADIKVQQKSEKPPQLFNLTGLQKYCSAHFNLSPKTTLEIAQSLYEELKVLSYPRTPSTVLGDDNVNLFLEKYNLLKDVYSDYSINCDVSNISQDNKHIFNSKKLQDHHALIPLAPIPDSATELQKKVFMSVVERFFNLIKPDYIYNSINVTGVCKYFNFIGTGKQILQKGFTDSQKPPFGGLENSEEDLQEEIFPELKVGDSFEIQELKFLEKFTKPKKHFTNSSLLSLMENPKNEDGEKICGLGTPATRADIISKLFENKYIIEDKKNLLITDKGKFLIEKCLQNPIFTDFIKIETTTLWEKKLEDSPTEFLDDIKNFTIKAILTQTNTTAFQDSKIGVCPVCKKGSIKESEKSFYCSDYKSGCKFTIWKNVCGAKLSASDVQLLISGKKTRPKKMVSKTGKDFFASLIFQNGKTEFVFN